MDLKIRQACKSDYKKIELLTRDAFWNVYKPGCDEHLVVHNMHRNKSSIEELELVAVCSNKIVGHILYSRGYIKGMDNNTFLTFGPLSVSPSFQKKGIGSSLVKTSLEKAYDLGISAVFITGNPDYYSRFGFESASKYGIYLDGIPLDDDCPFFMVKSLKKDALKNMSGIYLFDKSFYVDSNELSEFEKQFPYKKKEVREGQL